MKKYFVKMKKGFEGIKEVMMDGGGEIFSAILNSPFQPLLTHDIEFEKLNF